MATVSGKAHGQKIHNLKAKAEHVCYMENAITASTLLGRLPATFWTVAKGISAHSATGGWALMPGLQPSFLKLSIGLKSEDLHTNSGKPCLHRSHFVHLSYCNIYMFGSLVPVKRNLNKDFLANCALPSL